MKKRVKLISILGVVLLFVLLFSFLFLGKEESAKVDKEYMMQEYEVKTNTIIKNLTSAVELEGNLSEQIGTRTGYTLKESYITESSYIREGENVLKYSNGTYMKAPYNAIVSKISLPDEGEICTNSHYIQFTSIDTLKISVSINEAEIRYVEIGRKVNVTLNAFEKETFEGYITHVDTQGTYENSTSTFNVEITLQNNGKMKVGMSGYSTIEMEKKENILTVPIEAVTYEEDKPFVNVLNANGTIIRKELTLGIADYEKAEVISGLEIGEMVQYETFVSGASR